MIDRTTGKPIRVLTDAVAGAYFSVPYDQLVEVRQTLDAQDIGYRVQENIISLNGGPFVAVVNLGRGVDAAAVQALLDGVP